MNLRKKGFTLIELLVVIGIIAIIAAILFPVFAQVRAKSRQAVCASNERQLLLAFQMYADDYDCLPSVIRGFDVNGAPIFGMNWIEAIYPYVNNTQIFYHGYAFNAGWSARSIDSAPESGNAIAIADWVEVEVVPTTPFGGKVTVGGMGVYRTQWGGFTECSYVKCFRDPNYPHQFITRTITVRIADGPPPPTSADLSWQETKDGVVTVRDATETSAAQPGGMQKSFFDYGGKWSEWLQASVDQGERIRPSDFIALMTQQGLHWGDPSLRDIYKHSDGQNIGFLDGHVKWYSVGVDLLAAPGSVEPTRLVGR